MHLLFEKSGLALGLALGGLDVVPRLLAPHPIDGLVGGFDDVKFVERDLGVREVLFDPRLECSPMSMLASVTASRRPLCASRSLSE
jgi:hypothetical protein